MVLPSGWVLVRSVDWEPVIRMTQRLEDRCDQSISLVGSPCGVESGGLLVCPRE